MCVNKVLEFLHCFPFSLLPLLKVPSHMIIEQNEFRISKIRMAPPLKCIYGLVLLLLFIIVVVVVCIYVCVAMYMCRGQVTIL